MARYCLGGEEAASYVSMAGIIPTLIGAVMAVELCKKYDKFKVFYISYVFALLLGIVRFMAGYENMTVYVILNALGGIPLGIAVILQYQFTPDCYEYGQYKTGLKMRGVTFAAQTFFAKLNGAITTAVSVFALTLIGFREGEGVVQAAGFADKLWIFSCLGSIIGGICTLLILRFYKLNDHDVQLMAKCNNGEISREEAEAQNDQSVLRKEWRTFAMDRIKELISKMTLEEKASLCSGADNWHTKEIKRLNIPSVMMVDGPHGLRKQEGETDHLGLNESVKAVCFPAAVQQPPALMLT